MRKLIIRLAVLLLLYHDGCYALKLFVANRGKPGQSSEQIIEAIEAKSKESVVQGLLDEVCVSSGGSVKALKRLTGCFEVKRTLKEPSWTKYAKLLGTDTTKNYQIFSSRADNKFINLSEYRFGCFATASGMYRRSSPGTFEALVTKSQFILAAMLSLYPFKEQV